MRKHILDHGKQKGEGTRVEKYAEIDRKSGGEGSSEAAKSLYKRPREHHEDNRRTEEYLRIDRKDGD